MEDNSGILKKILIAGGLVGAAIASKSLLDRRREEDLRSEVALITGGTRGLGYLIARELGREGCRLAICARDAKELKEAEQELARQGFIVTAVECDVSDQSAVQSMIETVTDHYGRIDILVNNAGIIQFGPAQSMTRSDFANAMDIMYWGTVNTTLAALPQMVERQSGRIVNVTSVGGKVSVPHLVPYNSAKYAALGFSEGMHAELYHDGITVTTIVPGLMRTGSFVNAEFKGQTEKEYTWFSLMSSLPVLTIDAERAARQIVTATKRGEAERILSIPANILARLHGIAPAMTNRILGLVDKFVLPNATGQQEESESGMVIQDRIDSKAQRAATELGHQAARDHQPQQNRPHDTVDNSQP